MCSFNPSGYYTNSRKAASVRQDIHLFGGQDLSICDQTMHMPLITLLLYSTCMNAYSSHFIPSKVSYSIKWHTLYV